MIFLKNTELDVDSAVTKLTSTVEKMGYSVLHTYDLKAKMNEKGVEFDRECRILEVCNPSRAAAVLTEDMRVSMALPCRICVYQDAGETVIGTLMPSALIGVFSEEGALQTIAGEVESDILAMVEQTVA